MAREDTSVKWRGFAYTSSVHRTFLHFFPASHHGNAPYSVIARCRVFGGENPPEEIALEGLRLAQPDGFRLDEAFSDLEAKHGTLCGFDFELVASENRIDLAASRVAVELVSGASSVRFWLTQCLSGERESQKNSPLLLVRDAFHLSSLILVNAGEKVAQPKLVPAAERVPGSLLAIGELGPHSAVEWVPSPEEMGNLRAAEASWGLTRALGLELSLPQAEDLSAFAIYRDALSRQPVSVCAL